MKSSSFPIPEIGYLNGLFSNFELDHLISEGSNGAVFKANQHCLDRDVALKIIPKELGQDTDFRATFETQAKLMATLVHPNLIRVFDSGEADGFLFLAMEYVPGKALGRSARGIAVDAKQAAKIITAACEGIAYAHDNGAIHMGISPSSILLDQERQPKIGDFGLTRSDPAYTAPELLDGTGKATPQSDMYALGIILRELLTGFSPEATDAEPAEIRDRELAAICAKATESDPRKRFKSVSSMAKKLTKWMRRKPTGILATANAPLGPGGTVRIAVPSTARSPVASRPGHKSVGGLSTSARPIRRKVGRKKTVVKSHQTGYNWSFLRNLVAIVILGYMAYFLYNHREAVKGKLSKQKQEQKDTPKRVIITVDPDQTPPAGAGDKTPVEAQ